jgi:hypothetical protein
MGPEANYLSPLSLLSATYKIEIIPYGIAEGVKVNQITLPF